MSVLPCQPGVDLGCILGVSGHLSVGFTCGFGQRERAGAILPELPARPGQREPRFGHQLRVRLGFFADAERPLQDGRRLARVVFENQGLAEGGQRDCGPLMVWPDPLRRELGGEAQIALRLGIAAQELVRFPAVSQRLRQLRAVAPIGISVDFHGLVGSDQGGSMISDFVFDVRDRLQRTRDVGIVGGEHFPFEGEREVEIGERALVVGAPLASDGTILVKPGRRPLVPRSESSLQGLSELLPAVRVLGTVEVIPRESDQVRR